MKRDARKDVMNQKEGLELAEGDGEPKGDPNLKYLDPIAEGRIPSSAQVHYTDVRCVTGNSHNREERSGEQLCVPADEAAVPKPQVSGTEEREMQEIRALKTIEPEGLRAIAEEGEWEEIEMAVDSGATETVVIENMVMSVEVRDGPASRRGVCYEVADGTTIPNLGEKKFTAVSEEGTTRNITAQVCAVNKALLSVKKMARAGNRIVFDEDGSYVEDKVTGERMWMRDEGGMYMLKMWVKKVF